MIIFNDEFICNDDIDIWLLYDWWCTFRNDILPIFLKWYFEITFISHKKGLCWPSVWDYLHFDIRSAQSLKAICYALRFDMIYDFHFEMSNAFLFSFWNALWLSFRNEWAKFSSIELFSSGATQIFYWRKHPIIYIFRTQFFTQGLVPILALK